MSSTRRSDACIAPGGEEDHPFRDRRELFQHGIAFPPDRRVVVVDIDGTLADLRHREHLVRGRKKRWGRFFALVAHDAPVETVVAWVRALAEDHTIVLVSGRPADLTGRETVQWLHRHDIPHDYLFMRAPGDFRPDTVVKQEILDAMLKTLPRERIAFCIDDRLSVVRMWRSNGLTVYPVRVGDREFE